MRASNSLTCLIGLPGCCRAALAAGAAGSSCRGSRVHWVQVAADGTTGQPTILINTIILS